MVSSPIDLKKLRAFSLVAKHGNLRDAASRLLLSTSAISIQINQLEKQLGVKLFDRVGRKLVLLPAGQIFLDHVPAVFGAVDDAVASIAKTKATKNRISIAVGPDLTRIFAAAIGKFMRNHPDVEIALQLKHAQESLARILDGEIDMVVGYFGKLPKELVKRTFIKSGFTMSFAAAHPLAKITSPTLRDMAAYPVIALRQQTNMGQRILRAYADAGVEPANYLEVGNCQSSLQLAVQSIGVAVAHATCLEGYQSGEMRSIDATQFFGKVDVAVVHHRSRALSSLHQELLDDMALDLNPSHQPRDMPQPWAAKRVATV